MTEQSVAVDEVFRVRDLLGWEVVDRAGEKIGTVADVLFDRTGKVRMLHAEFGFPRKHVLLPQHELEWGEQRFILGRRTKDQVRSLPPYDPGQPLAAPVLEEMGRAYPWFYDAAWPQSSEPAGASEARILPLSEAKEFKLGPGAPDLKGWNVFGSDGERLGTVHQMLVDPATLKIRYLDVDLLEDLFHLRDDRHILVPLEHVDLKERGNDVWVRGAITAELARFPAYTGGEVEPWLQRKVAEAFPG